MITFVLSETFPSGVNKVPSISISFYRLFIIYIYILKNIEALRFEIHFHFEILIIII